MVEQTNMVQISIKYEGNNGKSKSFWGKVVDNINNQTNGYAFEGEWLAGWKNEKVAMAKEGQLVIIYAQDDGYIRVKRRIDQIYAIGVVKRNCNAELKSPRFIKVQVQNIDVKYVLVKADDWTQESTELFKQAMQLADRTITNPWDALKVLVQTVKGE